MKSLNRSWFKQRDEIGNGDGTEWTLIRSLIIRVINKIGRLPSAVRFLYLQFTNQDCDHRQNWTTGSPIAN